MAYGGKGPSLSLLMMMVGVVSATTAVATKHIVGGTAVGWTIPPNFTFYSQWAAPQSFLVGDSLVFNFPTGAHDVMQVDKSGYDACSAKGQIGSTLSSGPATIPIRSVGEQYYICGVPGHCSGGQKLAITVTSSPPSSSPSPSPSPSPSASAASSPPPAAGSPTSPSPFAVASPPPAAGSPTSPSPFAVASPPPAAGSPSSMTMPTSTTGAPSPSAPAGLVPSGSGQISVAPSLRPCVIGTTAGFCIAVALLFSMASPFLL